VEARLEAIAAERDQLREALARSEAECARLRAAVDTAQAEDTRVRALLAEERTAQAHIAERIAAAEAAVCASRGGHDRASGTSWSSASPRSCG
jgi:chromosome segregation ATPase